MANSTSAHSESVTGTKIHWLEVGRIGLVGLLTFLFWRGWIGLPILIATVLIGLYPLVKTGILDLVRERKIGTEIFVTIATTIAMIGGEYVAGAVLMCIILIAEFIASLNTDRARASIKALIGSVPQTAIIREPAGDRPVPIHELKPGDVVLAKAGEKIPADGIVVAGAASVNEASITGESLPVEKTSGSSVLAGTLVESGALDVRTERVGADTMFARIISLVENAEAHQAPVEKLADKVASWLIPIVFVFLLVVYFLTRDLNKIVTLLIFTSPAELGLATPLVMIAAVARAAKQGVLIKGGLYLELLAKVDVIVFDKTGTLTAGKPKVIGIQLVPGGFNESDLLRLAAGADRRSGHPLAQAVVEAASKRQLDIPEPTEFEILQGRGVRAMVNGNKVLVGNPALLRENGVEPIIESGGSTGISIHVSINGQSSGILQLADEIRPESRAALARLKSMGIKRTVLLTGDSAREGARIGAELGIDEVQAELLPEHKVDAIARLQQQGFRVAMVGDGINDAPALARADVGIAMGARGTQAALEAADIALMTDDLSKIGFARALARRSYRTIQENIFVGVGVVHVLGITAALMGWIGPIQAAMLHLGPDILVFVNSVKLLRVRLDD